MRSIPLISKSFSSSSESTRVLSWSLEALLRFSVADLSSCLLLFFFLFLVGLEAPSSSDSRKKPPPSSSSSLPPFIIKSSPAAQSGTESSSDPPRSPPLSSSASSPFLAFLAAAFLIFLFSFLFCWYFSQGVSSPLSSLSFFSLSLVLRSSVLEDNVMVMLPCTRSSSSPQSPPSSSSSSSLSNPRRAFLIFFFLASFPPSSSLSEDSDSDAKYRFKSSPSPIIFHSSVPTPHFVSLRSLSSSPASHEHSMLDC
mmetsp:Transcript_13982/g.28649  ORF Transcript_13982/g.28649 Transcript_13982/m.28649 type:complete len:254 (+) Transcript_13982:384-1145(+)